MLLLRMTVSSNIKGGTKSDGVSLSYQRKAPHQSRASTLAHQSKRRRASTNKYHVKITTQPNPQAQPQHQPHINTYILIVSLVLPRTPNGTRLQSPFKRAAPQRQAPKEYRRRLPYALTTLAPIPSPLQPQPHINT